MLIKTAKWNKSVDQLLARQLFATVACNNLDINLPLLPRQGWNIIANQLL